MIPRLTAGKAHPVQPINYDLYPGDTTSQIMGAFTAGGTMAFSLANILLPEVHQCECPRKVFLV